MEAKGYDLIRLDWSRPKRGVNVSCYNKCSIGYSYKGSFCNNIERIFTDIYMFKFKPMLLGILYRTFDKSDFVKNINNVFTKAGVLGKQEC